MPTFLAGLGLGFVSGGVTYGLTADGHLAALASAIAAVLTWCGVATLLLLDD